MRLVCGTNGTVPLAVAKMAKVGVALLLIVVVTIEPIDDMHWPLVELVWHRLIASGNVAAPVGKLNFSDEQLADNINTFLNHLRTVKPAAAKGTYIRTITISATMSPGIRVLA